MRRGWCGRALSDGTSGEGRAKRGAKIINWDQAGN
jgi:hypothetical protein